VEHSIDVLFNIDSIQQAKTTKHALNAFAEICIMHGFNGVFYATNVKYLQRGKGQSREYVKMPFKWKANYFLKQYLLTDPVLKWCVEYNHPATWQTIAEKLYEKHHPIWADAAKYGMVDGIAMPVFLSKKIGILSISSSTIVDSEMYAYIMSVGRYFAAKIHFLEGGIEMPVLGDKRFEREDLNILSMVLQGLSDIEIAEVMNTNRQSINRRLKSYMELTGISNRYRTALALHWARII